MKCPYCKSEMISGKVCAIGKGAAIYWKDEKIDMRLNDEPKFVAYCNGDRISGQRCEKCKKIIIEYNEK